MRDFIIQAEVRGIQLSANAGRLDVKAPKGTLTPAILDYMKRNKPALIKSLSGEVPETPRPALPKSVYACIDYLRRTKFEKPLTPKLEAWLDTDIAITKYEDWLTAHG